MTWLVWHGLVLCLLVALAPGLLAGEAHCCDTIAERRPAADTPRSLAFAVAR